MNNKSLTIIWSGGFLLIATCFLILGSVLDMEVSQQMFSGDSFFSYFGSVFGKMPGYLVMALGFTFLYTAGRRRGFRGLDLVFNIVYLSGVAASFTLMFLDASELLLSSSTKLWQFLFALIVGCAFSILAVKMYKRTDDELLLKLKKWSVASIAAIAAIALLTLLLKIGWGRSRYLDIIADGSKLKFTEWWVPAAKGGDSFPSGHVALATCGFFLLPFVDIVTEGNLKYLLIADSCVSVFTLLIAFFRIMGGYHFMSDVAVSMFIVTAAHFFAMRATYGENFDQYYFGEHNPLNRL